MPCEAIKQIPRAMLMSASSGASFFSDYVTIRLEYNELLAVLDVDAWNGGVSYLAAHNVECRSVFTTSSSLHDVVHIAAMATNEQAIFENLKNLIIN